LLNKHNKVSCHTLSIHQQVLARHGSSIKIVTLYVKFLQNVRNDPWNASRWSTEVEKMQHLEEEANERAVFGNAENAHIEGLENNDNTKGVIIIGANCLIRMINEVMTPPDESLL
jgi:hypothetical protein